MEFSRDRRVDHYWNTKNSDGDTPMMYCLKNNKIEMARLLVSLSAKLEEIK